MKSRKQFITEPGDRRWLDASAWAAVAGGLVVVLLLVAIALLPPRGTVTASVDRPALSAAPLSTATTPPPDAPAHSLPAIAPDAESYAAPNSPPPTF